MRNHHKRIVQSGGATPDGNIPFPLMTKGERFIICRGHRQIYQMQRIEAWFHGDHE
jgi:hypothetical protein